MASKQVRKPLKAKRLFRMGNGWGVDGNGAWVAADAGHGAELRVLAGIGAPAMAPFASDVRPDMIWSHYAISSLCFLPVRISTLTQNAARKTAASERWPPAESEMSVLTEDMYSGPVRLSRQGRRRNHRASSLQWNEIWISGEPVLNGESSISPY